MSRPRIAILIASHATQHTRRNFRRELDADLAEFHVVEGQLPSDFDFDGFVVTGSSASVYWDEDWIPPTERWVMDAIDQGIPALGICFGHQLLAHVLGGTVDDMGEYELGYRTVRRTADAPIFDGFEEEFLVFTSHSDAVTELPPGAELIAENEYGIHGFQQGDVFGIQAHPEYDRPTARAVTEGKDLPDDHISRVLDGITEENYETACSSKALFDNFVTYVEDISHKEAIAGDD